MTASRLATWTTASALTSWDLRYAFSQVPSSVVAIGGHADGQPIGMTAATFVPVSLEPPLVSVCIQATSSTWPKLSPLPHVGISVLSVGQAALARRLAGPSSIRFANVEVHAADNSSLYVTGSILWLDCVLASQTVAGDHLIVLFEIHAVFRSGESDGPLIFHGSTFRRLEAAQQLADDVSDQPLSCGVVHDCAD